jgi:hypothetical protein
VFVKKFRFFAMQKNIIFFLRQAPSSWRALKSVGASLALTSPVTCTLCSGSASPRSVHSPHKPTLSSPDTAPPQHHTPDSDRVRAHNLERKKATLKLQGLCFVVWFKTLPACSIIA